jgi:hypothetical protein
VIVRRWQVACDRLQSVCMIDVRWMSGYRCMVLTSWIFLALLSMMGVTHRLVYSIDHAVCSRRWCVDPGWARVTTLTWALCWVQGQAPYYQQSCCGNRTSHPKAGQHELDLSFWAYEQLAHPEYPEMMLLTRCLHCPALHGPAHLCPRNEWRA